MALPTEDQENIRRAIEEYKVDAPFGRLLMLGRLTTKNIDEAMAMLPAPIRDDFIEWAQYLVRIDGIPFGWQIPLAEDSRTMLLQWLTHIGREG